jgi:hypothetical protein
MKILVCISKSPDTTSKVAFTDGNTKFDEKNQQQKETDFLNFVKKDGFLLTNGNGYTFYNLNGTPFTVLRG